MLWHSVIVTILPVPEGVIVTADLCRKFFWSLLEVPLVPEGLWRLVLLGTLACLLLLADIGALDGREDEGAVEDDADAPPVAAGTVIDLDMRPTVGADVFLALPLSGDEYFSGA